MMQYEIYEGNMNRVEKHMNKIAKKCEKYGCDFHYEIVGETFKDFEIDVDDNGNKLDEPMTITRRFVIIEVEGKAIVNNWRFIGSIERTENGNIFHKTVDVEIPTRYYDNKPVCEHCNTRRARKHTYIIQNTETNEFKQVGATCLRDFTKGMDAEFIASYYSMFNKLAEFEAPMEGCGYRASYFNTEEILAYTVAVVNKFGYIKSDSSDSTANTVREFYGYERGWYNGYLFESRKKHIKEKMDACNFNVSEEDFETANKIIAYVNDMEESNNYIHNIKVLCANKLVAYGNINMLCSAIVCWNKNLEREAKKAEREKANAHLKDSKYIGEINDRIVCSIKEWKILTSWETMYGVTLLYRFIDEDGNVIIWKTSKWLDDSKDYTTIKGTVKAHKDFNGIKQTELTRCKVA